MPEPKASVSANAACLLQMIYQANPEVCETISGWKIEVFESITENASLKQALIINKSRKKAHVSFLGLLNSILINSGCSKVVSLHDENGDISGFAVLEEPKLVSVPPVPPATKS